MSRLALLSVCLSGCSLYWDDHGSAPGTGPDAGVDPGRCPPHTGTIFEPADGATVPHNVTFRVRWNESGIPDRYTSMEDDFGNFFINSTSDVINGDGSISMTYDLPAGGAFNFEMGWFCDAGNDGPTVVLAKRRIKTI
jgi:hypothetical protein